MELRARFAHISVTDPELATTPIGLDKVDLILLAGDQFSNSGIGISLRGLHLVSAILGGNAKPFAGLDRPHLAAQCDPDLPNRRWSPPVVHYFHQTRQGAKI